MLRLIFWFTLTLIQMFYLTSSQVVNPKEGVSSSCNYFYNQTDPDLVLKSPGFDTGSYPNKIKCAWTIESPEQAAGITIRFKYFDLEPTKRCSKYDYVMLYAQGNGEATWKPIGADVGYCGFHESINITETTKRVVIIFRSDDTRTFTGFNATFTIQITQAKPRITCLSLLENTKKGGSCNTTIEVEEWGVFLVQSLTRAIPPATYKWEKQLNVTHWEPIDQRIIKNIFPNGSIQFHQVREWDFGKYRCYANNKHGADDQSFDLFVKEKCLCPKSIRMSWYQYPPYTKHQAGSDRQHNAVYKGIFYVALEKMIKSVCGTCKNGHGESIIIWDDPKNLKKQLTDVKKEIESENKEEIADVFFPIEGGQLDDKYRNIFYFIPMVDSPGVAFMVPGLEEGASAMAIFSSVLQGKPILILTIVMAVLAGIIMWMLDTYWNEEQFPRNFTEGIAEGFWWAFVTMTTVGYGDIAPVGVPGRLFAIIWILTGLVIIAIFTGVITTSLTVVALTSNVKLYGTKVGAMNNTAEYRMGVIKNANMIAASTFEDLAYKLENRQIEGALLDSYVAAYHRDKFGKFRVNNIFKSLKAFGIVLGPRLSSSMLYNKFKNYIEENKASITQDIEKNTDTLTEPDQSAAEEASSDLFNPSSKLFVQSMTFSSVLLVVFGLIGFFFDRFYLQPRTRMIEAAKNLEMIESGEVKEMAKRAKLLTSTLLHEVQLFYDSWSDVLGTLTQKHKAQQTALLQRGKKSAARASAPPRHFVEEAIEMEQADASVDTPQEKLSSRPSTASSSNTYNTSKSTTSLIRKESEINEMAHDDSKDSKDNQNPSSSSSSTSHQQKVESQPPPTPPIPGTPEQASPPSTSPINQGSRITLINNEDETDL